MNAQEGGLVQHVDTSESDPNKTYTDIKARIEELCPGLIKETLDTVVKAIWDANINEAALTDVQTGTKTGLTNVLMNTDHIQARPRLQADQVISHPDKANTNIDDLWLVRKKRVSFNMWTRTSLIFTTDRPITNIKSQLEGYET